MQKKQFYRISHPDNLQIFPPQNTPGINLFAAVIRNWLGSILYRQLGGRFIQRIFIFFRPGPRTIQQGNIVTGEQHRTQTILACGLINVKINFYLFVFICNAAAILHNLTKFKQRFFHMGSTHQTIGQPVNIVLPDAFIIGNAPPNSFIQGLHIKIIGKIDIGCGNG